MLRTLIFALLLASCFSIVTLDLNQQNKDGSGTILDTTCNKDSQIDLMFDSNSKINCDGSTCTTSSLGSSTMKFMDINGNDLDLTLASAQAVSNTNLVVNNLGVTPNYYYVMRFDTTDGARKVYVAVPVMTAASANTNVINVNGITDGTF